jgi:hypothetical protein
MPDDAAEEQIVQPGQESLVQAHEQVPTGQGKRLHGADARRFLAVRWHLFQSKR